MTKATTIRVDRSSAPDVALDVKAGPEWMRDPRRGCNPDNVHPELFFAEKADRRHEAEKICERRCPFVSECDQWASDNEETHGVWGGVARYPGTARKAAGGLAARQEARRVAALGVAEQRRLLAVRMNVAEQARADADEHSVDVVWLTGLGHTDEAIADVLGLTVQRLHALRDVITKQGAAA